MSKFPSMELSLQYEIAELLKSAETKGANTNEKNIMRMQMEMQMEIQSAETKVIKAKQYSKKALSNEKNIMRVQMEFQKNITTNYYLKLLSHLTQR